MMKIFSANTYFILVEPQTPGNVGAAARAIKTMGFTHLRLVNPCDIRRAEARWMAHASLDILENAQVFPSLAEALADIHFAVATTQREREFHFPFYTPKQLAEHITPLTQEHKVALVFGREKTGLTNEEIRMCHAISTVPAAVTHPSLNLAQAVMVYAYELFQFSHEREKQYQGKLATHPEVEALYRHLEESLRHVQFKPMDNWEKFITRFRRFFGRRVPEVRDVRLMHKILQAFDSYIQKLEKELKTNREKQK